jgi:SAM-dependent methyltransferase
VATDDTDSIPDHTPESAPGIEHPESATASRLDEDRQCPVCESPDCVVYLAPTDPVDPAEADDSEDADPTEHSNGTSKIAASESTPLGGLQQQTGTVLRCKRCKLAFRENRPDLETLAKYYEEQDVEPYLSELAGRRWTARRRWELVKPLMLRGHVLDVGCASGLFLEQLERGGWTGTGIEPSLALCDYARDQMDIRVNVICGTLESSGFPPSLFDVVTLWDVLEHAPKPVDFVRASSVPLKPGGYLVLNVPYIDSSTAQFLGSRWPLLVPEHLNYFSRESLSHCAEAAGLTVERFGHRSAISSLRGVLRRLAEHEIPLASGLSQLVARLRIGEWLVPAPLGEIIAIFKKPEA